MFAKKNYEIYTKNMGKREEFARRLLEIRILSDNICDGWNRKNIEVYQKIMFLIDEYGVCSPSLLISKIGIKKSNLALACKTLLEQGKITKINSQEDKRQIFYKLTEKGRDEINKIVGNIEHMFRQSEIGKNEYQNMARVCDILNKKR